MTVAGIDETVRELLDEHPLRLVVIDGASGSTHDF